MKKTVVVSVRMSEDLRERIVKRASADVRSASQEIVWLLNLALETLERQDDDGRPASPRRPPGG